MLRLWRIEDSQLESIERISLQKESLLEDWIERDSSILGRELLIIGRQVQTGHGGVIDLLALDSEGNVTIIEIKRDQTPREVVAQVLDYASWVKELTPGDVRGIGDSYFAREGRNTSLVGAFQECFAVELPEELNVEHSMLIVASGMDPQSDRIVKYLAETHGLNINTATFNVFRDGERDYLAANWLMHQEVVEEKAAVRRHGPWTGYWYVNVGDGIHRSWEDCRRYGFVAAGNGRQFSGQLRQLKPGALLYAYQKAAGYVGYGEVISISVPARDFQVNGRPLLALDLKQKALGHDLENPELCEHLVGVRWIQTVSIDEAKRFSGAFANQNIVCKLRATGTLEFLAREFGASS